MTAMDLDFSDLLPRRAGAFTSALAPPATENRTCPTALYRWRDAVGVPIYTGITDNLPRRQGQHGDGAVWTQFADTCSIEVLPTRHDASAAEKSAIADERPIFNVQHNDTIEAFDRMVRYLDSVGRADVLERFEGVSGLCSVQRLGVSLLQALTSRASDRAPAPDVSVEVLGRKTVQVCLAFEALGDAHPVWLWISQIPIYHWGPLTCAFSEGEMEGFGPFLGSKRLMVGGRHEDDFAERFAAEIERSVLSCVGELIAPKSKSSARRKRT